MPAGKLHAALADNRVVLVRKSLGEFIDSGNAAGPQDLLFTRVRPRKGDIFANRAVEQERLLQNHSQLCAIRVEPDGAQIDAIDQDSALGRHVESRDQADDG